MLRPLERDEQAVVFCPDCAERAARLVVVPIVNNTVITKWLRCAGCASVPIAVVPNLDRQTVVWRD